MADRRTGGITMDLQMELESLRLDLSALIGGGGY